MLDIANFWNEKLKGSAANATSALAGWSGARSVPDGFIEPTLKIVYGDPATSRLLIIAAPGAVGKSSYANALASHTQAAVVDLALASQLGGNFFTGGLAKAFGLSSDKVALIVDALDEAQMRAGPQGFEAGLDDLASLVGKSPALPTVMLGRAIAAEDAYLHLAANGHEPCLLEIQYFNDEQARQYIEGKLPLLAARSESLASAYANHVQPYRDLAHEARSRLIDAAGSDRERFAGYAPVLDAICAFALQDLNPKSRIEELSATSAIGLIREIISAILRREQEKLQTQFNERHPEIPDDLRDLLYSPAEQLGCIAAKLFGTKPPAITVLSNQEYQATYREMVGSFSPQHPFVSAGRTPSNPVFAAYVVAWALRQTDISKSARRAVAEQPNLLSPILFELYVDDLDNDDPYIPLEDVGVLYQALNSQVVAGERVQLEINGDDDKSGLIEVSFDILERGDSECEEASQDKSWGPYRTSSDGILELRSPFSNIHIDAPIFVQLGDGITQQISAPTSLRVDGLGISAHQVLVVGSGLDNSSELQNVSLVAGIVECEAVQSVEVAGATLSVCWDNAKVFPWNSYAIDVAPPANEDVGFLRRRMRNILTAFRSHSKGALRRLAAKIEHSRMTKDERGKALLDQLIADKILFKVLSGKFYELDTDAMGSKLFMSYHDLAQSRFTPELDSYLLELLSKIRTQ